MTSGVIAEAAGLFAVTNFDDIVILSLFFAQGAGQRGSAAKVVTGQYLAFTAILAVAIGVTFGASFLPEEVPYLGLLPIAIGLRDARKIWRNRTRGDNGEQPEPGQGGPTVLKVATTTFANGGDNIGRGASAMEVFGIRRARHGLCPHRWERGYSMAAVMIGVDPHKASHTAVAISMAEEPLGELRVRACVAQAGRLLAWAQAWPQRTWAVEGAGGTGHLLAQQLLSAGERVLDVQPKLAARVRLLAAGT